MNASGDWFKKKFRKKPKPAGAKSNVNEIPLDMLTENVVSDVLQKQVNGFCTASDMQDSILDLCRLLSRKTSEGDFDCEAWVKNLEDYLSSSAGRLMYSSISNYIFNKTEQELTTFATNLDFVLHYVESKAARNIEDDRWKKSFKAVLKFYDHSNLAIQQQKLVNKKRVDLEHEVSGVLAPKISEITKEMTSQLVGLIGIFTALSFIVFGGISSLDSIFGAIQGTLDNQTSILPVLIVAVAWSICMMNLLFGFMYFVIRITHLSKTANENNEKSTNMVQRYPIVFLCNYVLLALLALFSGMWFARENDIGKSIYKSLVKDHSTGTFWCAIIIFIVVFALLGLRLWMWYRPQKIKPVSVDSGQSEDIPVNTCEIKPSS